MRESVVEDYLIQRVREERGTTRKVRWVSRAHCPDRRVMLPWVCAWVETKRPKKWAEAGQVREHERMRGYGEIVVVLNTKEAIDRWIAKTKRDYHATLV